MRNLLTYFYYFDLVAVSVYLMIQFRKVDIAAKIICMLVWLGCLTEGVAMYIAHVYKNNNPVYNPALYIEIAVISMYYNYSVPYLRKGMKGIYIGLAVILLGGINTFFYQGFLTFNSNLLFLECVMVLCLSMFSVYRMVSVDDDTEIYKRFHFWTSIVLLFNQCASLSAWGFYATFINDQAYDQFDLVILSINIITYLFFGILYSQYLKFTNTDVPRI